MRDLARLIAAEDEGRSFVSPRCAGPGTWEEKRINMRERRASRVKIAICPLSIRLFETFDFRRGEGRSGLHPGLVKRDERRSISASTAAAARRDIARFFANAPKGT